MGVANFSFNFLGHFCINFQNLCAHDQEEILTITKHPQKSSFWWFLAEKTAKNEVVPKIEYQNNFRKTLSSLEPHNLASNSPNWASWGCFGNLRTSSWWWPQRFWRLMHSRRFKACILILKIYDANCSCIFGKIHGPNLSSHKSSPGPGPWMANSYGQFTQCLLKS